MSRADASTGSLSRLIEFDAEARVERSVRRGTSAQRYCLMFVNRWDRYQSEPSNETQRKKKRDDKVWGKGKGERETAWVSKVFIRLETDRVGRDRRDYHRAWLGQECTHPHYYY